MFLIEAHGSCGAGFSLWGFILARPKTRRLKPAPLSAYEKNSGRDSIRKCGWATLLFTLLFALPVECQHATPKANPASAPRRDLSGLWHYESTGASEPIAPDDLIPPMTPWAKARFDAERPGF